MSLEGHLEDLSLADIFQIIHLSKKSGVLTVESDTGKGRIVFHEGQILYASMYDREKLGERLVREGLIKETDLEKALRIQKERKSHEPLGSILAENRFVDRDILEGILREQLKEIIYELLSWEEGKFKFEPEKLTYPATLGGNISPEYLLLEGSRLKDEGRDILGSQRSEIFSPNRNHGDILISFMEELNVPVKKTEALLMILRFAGEIMARAVLFSVCEDSIEGFGQVGFLLNGGEGNIRKLRIPADSSSILSSVVKEKKNYRGPISEDDWMLYLAPYMAGGKPEEIYLAPIIEDKDVIALLYADNLPSEKTVRDISALEVFIKSTGFALTVTKYIEQITVEDSLRSDAGNTLAIHIQDA